MAEDVSEVRLCVNQQEMEQEHVGLQGFVKAGEAHILFNRQRYLLLVCW